MSYARRGLRALGVSILAALGLMAVTAGGAQASGTFLIAGLAAPWSNVPIVGEADAPLANQNRFWILNLNIEVYCHEAAVGGTISSNGHGHAEIKFTTCLVHPVNSSGELILEPCQLDSSILGKTLVLVILHNSKPYLLFSPLEGKFLFHLTDTEPCPVPVAGFSGSIVATVSNPDGDDVTKLISTKGTLALFTTDKLFYGKNEVHLDADFYISLSGGHQGLKWGAA